MQERDSSWDYLRYPAEQQVLLNNMLNLSNLICILFLAVARALNTFWFCRRGLCDSRPTGHHPRGLQEALALYQPTPSD